MALGLHESPHHSERAEQVASWHAAVLAGTSSPRPCHVSRHCPRGKARNDGVVGPLPGGQAVGVIGVEREIVTAILEGEAAALGDDPGAKAPGGEVMGKEEGGGGERVDDADRG